jgi:glycosyltransferase involved in cell wall biosynthesis
VILEALAAGNCVLVNDHPPNAETVGDAGIYFSGRDGVASLSEQLGRLLDDEPLVARYRERARHRAEQYSWEAVTEQYERLLTAVHDAHRPGRLPALLIDAEPTIAG